MKTKLNSDILNENGLNMQAIFNINMLPDDMINALKKSTLNLSNYSQLILIGHGGATLWNSLQNKGPISSDPIDDFSIKIVTSVLKQNLNDGDFKSIYPGESIIPLLSLGELAGWHHPSLFRIGINDKWGTWFAYRAAFLTASNYETTPAIHSQPPCENCISKPCISACPVGAVQLENFDFKACFGYRKKPNSNCKDKCIARISCPIATEQRYPIEQIKYHYGRSLKSLKSIEN